MDTTTTLAILAIAAALGLIAITFAPILLPQAEALPPRPPRPPSVPCDDIPAIRLGHGPPFCLV